MKDSLNQDAAPKKAVVLGIGNVLLSDEGVGVHAIKALARRYDLPGEVEIVDGGTAGMELLPQLEGIGELIVVDAVRAGQPPAAIVRLEGDRLPAYFRTKLSPHQMGLSDVLAALAFRASAPGRVVLIGVQPVTLMPGLELSTEVSARLELLVESIAAELAAGGHIVSVRTEDE